MTFFGGRWVEVVCECGHITQHPVQLLAKRTPGASLCDIAAELACAGCGTAEPAVWVVSEVGRHPADDRPEPTRMAVLLAGGEGPF